MANYWAITIGINQYRHLQPLMHAQNDALFTHRFLTEEAGVASNHCVLLSDLTTSVGHQVVYPDKPAIAEWIHTITQRVGADDTLWFFFSGYGTQADGEDYLMPIDGDPQQAQSTGIAIASLIDTLGRLPTDRVLLILDINRSQGALAGQTIGTQVIDFAQRYQIPALLSCQPEQYSHETLGVRHGLFTAALLEALQQNCKTLSQISDYLTKRLPELCEHHWRPIQNPVSVIPEGIRSVTVVPEIQPIRDVDSPALSETANGQIDSQMIDSQIDNDRARSPELISAPYQTPGAASETAADDSTAGSLAAGGLAAGGLAAGGLAASGTLVEDPPLVRSPDTDEPPGMYGDRYSSPQLPDEQLPNEQLSDEPNGSSASSSAIVPYRQNTSGISGARLRNWGLLFLALLMGGVLLKQPFVKTAWNGLSERIGMGTGSEEQAEEPTEADNGTADGDSAETAPTDADTPDADTETPPAGNTEATPAVSNAVGAANDTANSPASEDEAAAAAALLSQANAAVEQRQYSEALIALQKVPQSQRNDAFSAVLTKARAGAAEAQQINASVLTEARTSIQPAQASQFTEAIAKARLIKEGEPSYKEAQEDIRSWSRIILDIAEGRATSGNLAGAIAAAEVMPYDNAEFRQKAQDRITFWQQRQRSRQIIAEAQQVPKSGQASTYQQGIVKLRQVPIEHPEYETSQRLADEWSERIFSIAQARAAQGRQSAAIQAAILVPAGTTAYEPAQQAIRRWQAAEQ